MDNQALYQLIETNQRLIEAMGMNWANQQALINKSPLPYNGGDFSNLAYKPFF